jgi:hypothetical protein
MLDGAEAWIRSHVAAVGPAETAHVRPWATVLRVPLAGGFVWFKACAPVQAFEPRLTAQLFGRRPDLMAEVLAYDADRSWLLLADAGTPMHALGNPPERWMELLPRYAELQRDEIRYATDHLAHRVPDLRLATLPARFDELMQPDVPFLAGERAQLEPFAGRFSDLCAELAGRGIEDTIQHDDLHAWNVFAQGDRLRVIDWGDASVSHPFMSMVVTFRFLEELNHLAPTDPWFGRLRDAYLEPWGHGHADAFDLALRIGNVAHVLVELRHRAALDATARAAFDADMRTVLERALAQVPD